MNKINDVVECLSEEMTRLEKEIEDANIPELKERLVKAQQRVDELSMMTSEIDMIKEHLGSMPPYKEESK